MTHAYDSLNRMMAASGNGWGETYGFDAFGSLLSKTPTAGTPPSLSQAVNPANNQIVGQSYDANGNQLTSPGYSGYATYDGENRIAAAPGVQYAYNSRNQRVWSGTVDSNNNLTSQHVYFYGITGKRLGTYSLNVSYGSGQPTEIADPPASLAMYFGGKRLDILEDRLGSNFVIPLYPWGEDRTGQSNDQTKFATYTRDSATLLDYADNRYYSNAYGRFMTPDPSRSSGGPSNPQSWNRYAYVSGDPVNFRDPAGLMEELICDADGNECGDGGGGLPNQDWGYCDPSVEDCGDPCVGADGTPSPGPGCQTSGVIVPPPVSSSGGNGFVVNKNSINTDLGKTNCYKLLGFASAAAAQSWFGSRITFHYQSDGRLQLNNGKPATDPAPANTLGYGQININTDYNWDDFSNVRTSAGTAYNYLSYINGQLGTNMNSSQLAALIIIHELGHQESAPKQPSAVESAAEKLLIYNDCIK